MNDTTNNTHKAIARMASRFLVHFVEGMDAHENYAYGIEFSDNWVFVHARGGDSYSFADEFACYADLTETLQDAMDQDEISTYRIEWIDEEPDRGQ